MTTEDLNSKNDKQQIIVVPIEPLTERYSEQWYRNFPVEFRNAGYDVITIDGQPLIEDDIKVGAFLDINSTVHYKMSQLQKIAAMFNREEVKPDTIFFFGDVEFWGLESVRLMARMNKVNVFITGFLHAASYTREDAFAIAADFQRYTEVGWIAALDRVYVGSQYHKKAVVERRLLGLSRTLENRIVVTKNPLFIDEYPNFEGVKKQKKVLLTNRFDQEKRPLETLNLFGKLKKQFPDWQFVFTTGRKALRGTANVEALLSMEALGIIDIKSSLTKEEYHRELAEAFMMVSHSIEENYGYCIAEALHYGCVPLLRDGLSHREFESAHLFHEENEAFSIAWNLMQDFENGRCPVVKAPDASGMQNIINDLKTLS